MQKTIIIYGSTTGNTEQIANKIAEVLREKMSEVKVKAVGGVSLADLVDYDLILLGSSTWGDGELQNDFIEFKDGLNMDNLGGKKVAIFGVGMSVYPAFCGAVDILEKKVKECKAKIITESLKIDWGAGEELEQAKEWATNLLK